MNSDLFMAVLALDAYNRGNAPGLGNLSNAPNTMIANARIIDSKDIQNIGFYATLRAPMVTTGDPDALGLVQSDSMQPITPTLASSHIARAVEFAPAATPARAPAERATAGWCVAIACDGDQPFSFFAVDKQFSVWSP